MPDSVSLHSFGFEPDKVPLASSHQRSASKDHDEATPEKQKAKPPVKGSRKSSVEEGVGENIDLEA